MKKLLNAMLVVRFLVSFTEEPNLTHGKRGMLEISILRTCYSCGSLFWYLALSLNKWAIKVHICLLKFKDLTYEAFQTYCCLMKFIRWFYKRLFSSCVC